MNNPILNSPYIEPTRHFLADDKGISDQVADFRRPSTTYIPVPRARARNSSQPNFGNIEGTFAEEMERENEFINKIRARVNTWRASGYPGITKTTRDLLNQWTDETRTNKLFFCQIEALETLIYINEVAENVGEAWVINQLKKANDDANSGMYRLAFKMATGSGKTVVMAMIIAYNTLNKARYPQDTRFTDAFAIITPGITIRDRLNVLLPNDPQNYYLRREIVTHQDFQLLQSAVVFITNFHQLALRDNQRFAIGGALKATGLIKEEVQKESPNAMVNRAFKSLMNKQRILVINDEAHHCYQEKPSDAKLTGDDRKEADENNEEARVWINGLKALGDKKSVNAVIDLSATPYFLRGSGYNEGELFPWTIYDFSLLDALECGVVKIPRLPVRDNTISLDNEPEFKNLWYHVKDDLPKKGMKTGEYNENAQIKSTKLELALNSLYGSYESYYHVYEKAKQANPDVMPPVMIVVCNNTAVSQMVYNWIAGTEYQIPTGGTKIQKGNLEIFRNENGYQMLEKPNTLVIDSKQLESGEKINDDFRRIFSAEIEDFHREYKRRFPGRDDPTDEELMREVMNTVGKPGKLGENIKCVVSVSMLTEGWDVNTVTHILGIRAFTTQLLCEQVVGRALRRVDYEAQVDPADGVEKFQPEYAEVYGVPFNFIKAEGSGTTIAPKVMHRVYAIEARDHYRIEFPRVEGYRFELDETHLTAEFLPADFTVIQNQPAEVTLCGAIGEEAVEYLTKVKEKREGEVITRLTQGIINRHFVDGDGTSKFWLFTDIFKVVQKYVQDCVVLRDDMTIGYLAVGEYYYGAISKIYDAITRQNLSEQNKQKRILPILAPYDFRGSTRYVDFLTTKPVSETVKSHINYVVADTREWEQGVALQLEDMPEVIAYVKNQNLGFTIPYLHQGDTRNYLPDFIAVVENSEGGKLNLLMEVTGKKDDAKARKVQTAHDKWIPAVNNDGRFGTWAFLEIQDIYQTKDLIRLGLEQGFEQLYRSAYMKSDLL
jgi:type III restriction enzyme